MCRYFVIFLAFIAKFAFLETQIVVNKTAHPFHGEIFVNLTNTNDQPEDPVPSEADHAWSHQDQDSWPGICVEGTRQSPIDIVTENLVSSTSDSGINFVNYDVAGPVEAENNGHGFEIGLFDIWEQRPYIEGGGLPARYLLQQLHFHWSNNSAGNGSEHTLDGQHFSAELHFVHVKEGLNLTEALGEPDGLVVVAVFYQLGTYGSALASLEDVLRGLTAEGTVLSLSSFSPAQLLPQNLQTFYRYIGSLTAPDCEESVIWTILNETVPINSDQLELLHAIFPDNIRRTQPLNGRAVLSF